MRRKQNPDHETTPAETVDKTVAPINSNQIDEQDIQGNLGFVRVTYVDEYGTIRELAQMPVESELEVIRVAKKCADRLNDKIVKRGVEAARS